MSLECGDQLYVRDFNGDTLTRFVWFCRGRWMALQTPGRLALNDPLSLPNGNIGHWQWVLGYLAQAAMRPGGGIEVTGSASGAPYVQLRPVMRVSELALLLGQSEDEVRADLTDYVIQVTDD